MKDKTFYGKVGIQNVECSNKEVYNLQDIFCDINNNVFEYDISIELNIVKHKVYIYNNIKNSDILRKRLMDYKLFYKKFELIIKYKKKV